MPTFSAMQVVAARASQSPPLPPPGLNYTAAVKATLSGVMLAHSFTVILIPLTIALFYFSTSHSRRQPIFILNVIAIALAFTAGVILDARGIRAILSPLNPPPLSLNLAVGVLGAVQSILVDTILLLRLLAVYPRSYVGRNLHIAMITLPVLLKIGRVTNLIVFMKALADATRNPATAPLLIAKVWSHAPYLKIEWFAQLIDNTYASAFFLVRLALRNRERNTDSMDTTSVTFSHRLKVLFTIAATNFVFPVLFSLAQIIIVFREINVVVINDVVLANTSVAVIGVVFATVWAGSANWSRSGATDQNMNASPHNHKAAVIQRGTAHSALVFRSSPGLVTDDFTDHNNTSGSSHAKHLGDAEKGSETRLEHAESI